MDTMGTWFGPGQTTDTSSGKSAARCCCGQSGNGGQLMMWVVRRSHPGRFVAGVTETSLGEVTVMGICIPWAGSRASGPNAKRRRWEDHAKYLEVLGDVIDRASSRNLIVVGDFNQRIDQGSSTPARLRGALERVFAGRLTVATAALGFQGRRSIDHIALSRDLAVGSLGVISNVHGETKLSDHFGVVADLHADVVQG